MNALETLIHESLTEHAAEAPSDDGLLAAVTARRRDVHHWLAAAAVAVLVLGIAAGAVLLGRTAGGPAASSDTRALSYHGITVDVPRYLGIVFSLCEVTSDSVQIEAFAQFCPESDPNHHPGVVVQLGLPKDTATSTGQTTIHEALEHSPIRRLTALGAGTSHSGEYSGYVNAPQANASVTVIAPTSGEVAGILDTVRLTPTSPLGCPSRAKVGTGGGRARLDPVSGAICVYPTGYRGRLKVGWLVASAALDGSDSREVAGDVREWIGRGHLARPTWQTYRVTFTYPDGSSRTVGVSPAAISPVLAHRLGLPR